MIMLNFFYLVFLKSEVTIKILPGDNLLLFLRLRKQLYISLDEGRAVLNNSILDEYSIDAALPISIRKFDDLFYGILIDGSPICSFGLFKDVAECSAAAEGHEQWILNGTEDNFQIEGSGGCVTRYLPESVDMEFKHGLRIEFCDENDNQKFLFERMPFNMI